MTTLRNEPTARPRIPHRTARRAVTAGKGTWHGSCRRAPPGTRRRERPEPLPSRKDADRVSDLPLRTPRAGGDRVVAGSDGGGALVEVRPGVETGRDVLDREHRTVGADARDADD